MRCLRPSIVIVFFAAASCGTSPSPGVERGGRQATTKHFESRLALGTVPLYDGNATVRLLESGSRIIVELELKWGGWSVDGSDLDLDLDLDLDVWIMTRDGQPLELLERPDDGVLDFSGGAVTMTAYASYHFARTSDVADGLNVFVRSRQVRTQVTTQFTVGR